MSALADSAARAHPNETGGLVAGVHAAGRPWITNAVEVVSACGSRPSYYELPAGTRAKIVEELRKFDPRLGYLGDWHSHPADAGPSSTDIGSIAAISEDSDCPRPLLVIVRRRTGSYVMDARQWTGASLRPLQLIAAGGIDAPPPDPRPSRKSKKQRKQTAPKGRCVT